MRIRQLTITNYRSIRTLCLQCRSFLTLLGPNNHGKSNVLSALEFGLSTSAKPAEEDFFAHRDTDELWVEMTFEDLTEQEATTFQKYVLPDSTVSIRKTARLNNGGIEIAYNGWINQPQEDWLCNENAAKYTTREAIGATPLKDLVPETGRISKSNVEAAQTAYVRAHAHEIQFRRTLEATPLLGQKNVGGGVLPEFYFVPAVRDLTDEMKIRTTTAFGRLMNRAVREMAERNPHFTEARAQLETVVSSLNQRDSNDKAPNEIALLEKNIEGELSAWGVSVNIEVAPPAIEKLFELGTAVHLDDGVRTTADRKGHGLQRAVIFALLRSWAAALRADKARPGAGVLSPRKQATSVVFAMEEPELFLHPHAQRRLSASLREISESPDHQVFLCTHSTYFVDLGHYGDVVIVRKDDPIAGSGVQQCTTELFAGEDVEERKRRFHMAEWINPDRGEIFFARRVVLVEGETEKVVIPYLAHRLDWFESDVSIVDCGSKQNLPLYVAIVEAFGIPYVVIHDEDPIPDPVPENWSADKLRERRRAFGLNQSIAEQVSPGLGRVEQLSPDFEGAGGIPRRQGRKKGKALAALDHLEGVPNAELPTELKTVVASAFGVQGTETPRL